MLVPTLNLYSPCLLPRTHEKELQSFNQWPCLLKILRYWSVHLKIYIYRMCAHWIPFLFSSTHFSSFQYFSLSLPNFFPSISEEETELLISKVMTPSFSPLLMIQIETSIDVNVYVCIYPCSQHVIILNTLVCIQLYSLFMKNLENCSISAHIDTTHNFYKQKCSIV